MAFVAARAVAAILLFVAVGDLPYDFYTILRWIVCGVSAYGAMLAHERKADGWLWTFGVIAAFFNPFLPVRLSREMWAPIDIATGLVLLGSLRSGVGRPPTRRQM